ncbi:hypothetical protein D3C84_967510 [compost metagenome]
MNVRAWPQQIQYPHVPQLCLAEAVRGQLAVGGVTSIDQDVEVQEVQRLAKVRRMTERDLMRVVGRLVGIRRRAAIE